MAKGKFHEWLTPESLLIVKGWARDGLNDEEIFKKIGISKQTFYHWIKVFPDFHDAIKAGRQPVLVKVEDTFFDKKLQGYYVDEEVTEKTVQKDAHGDVVGIIEHKRINKRYIPPDTTAMIFYMKCRMPEKYNDRISVTVDTNNGKLADLIDGLKEPCEDDIYTETESINEPMADEPPETN